MGQIITGDKFLAAITASEPQVYEVAGVGAVKIRGLTVREGHEISAKYEKSRADMVVQIVATGLVEPQLTPEQVEQLYNARSGPVNTLFEAIGELSAANKSEALEGEAGAGS